jgi:hypothetical protein
MAMQVQQQLKCCRHHPRPVETVVGNPLPVVKAPNWFVLSSYPFDFLLPYLFQQTKPVVETNGHLPDASQDTVTKKLPISFAAVATATSDTGKEVSVSA